MCAWHKQALQHHLPAQARLGWRLALPDRATWGLEDRRLAVPLPRHRALAAAAILAGTSFAVAVRAVLPAVDSTAAAVVEAPVALAAGAPPTAPRATLPAAATAALPTAAAAALPTAAAAALPVVAGAASAAAAAPPSPVAVLPADGSLLLLLLLLLLLPLLPYVVPLLFSSCPRWSGARWATASIDGP